MIGWLYEMVKENFDLLVWKWNQAMKNHAKNGDRNVYAEELLLYVLSRVVHFPMQPNKYHTSRHLVAW